MEILGDKSRDNQPYLTFNMHSCALHSRSRGFESTGKRHRLKGGGGEPARSIKVLSPMGVYVLIMPTKNIKLKSPWRIWHLGDFMVSFSGPLILTRGLPDQLLLGCHQYRLDRTGDPQLGKDIVEMHLDHCPVY
jgi:hypothetical protein